MPDDSGRALAEEEIELARRWGAAREIGVALRAAGLVTGGDEGIELLGQAVDVLRGSSARLELAPEGPSPARRTAPTSR